MTSSYYFQISKYLDYFSLDQLKIITLENLIANKMEVLNDIFSFLGVKLITSDNQFSFISNKSTEKKIYNKGLISLSQHNFFKILKQSIPKGLLNSLKSSPIYKRILFQNSKIHKVELIDPVNSKLKDFLVKDVEKLQALTGIRFNYWNL